MKWTIPLFIFFALLSAETFAAQELRFASGVRQTVMIELYTSQGCSSCPLAEEYLNGYVSHPGLWKTYIPPGLSRGLLGLPGLEGPLCPPEPRRPPATLCPFAARAHGVYPGIRCQRPRIAVGLVQQDTVPRNPARGQTYGHGQRSTRVGKLRTRFVLVRQVSTQSRRVGYGPIHPDPGGGKPRPPFPA